MRNDALPLACFLYIAPVDPVVQEDGRTISSYVSALAGSLGWDGEQKESRGQPNDRKSHRSWACFPEGLCTVTYLAAENKPEELSKVRVTSSPAQMISGVRSKKTNRSHVGVPLNFLYNKSWTAEIVAFLKLC